VASPRPDAALQRRFSASWKHASALIGMAWVISEHRASDVRETGWSNGCYLGICQGAMPLAEPQDPLTWLSGSLRSPARLWPPLRVKQRSGPCPDGILGSRAWRRAQDRPSSLDSLCAVEQQAEKDLRVLIGKVFVVSPGHGFRILDFPDDDPVSLPLLDQRAAGLESALCALVVGLPIHGSSRPTKREMLDEPRPRCRNLSGICPDLTDIRFG